MMDYLIYIIPAVVIVLIVIIAIVLKGKNKSTEETHSILEVDEVGVSNDSDFSYGYEKEETVVMNPVTEETKKEEFEDITEEENEESDSNEEKSE